VVRWLRMLPWNLDNKATLHVELLIHMQDAMGTQVMILRESRLQTLWVISL